MMYSKKKNISISSKEVFTKIYKTNYWNSSESVSGKGANSNQTTEIIKEINNIINDFNITKILDIPCGDFAWMQHINLSNISYIGADIVDDLIAKNKSKYSNITFKVLDLTKDTLPKSDLVLVRDCFVHLSYDEIRKSILNIKSSGSKFLLTTSFVESNSNFDINAGKWRNINLQKKPFNFPKPLKIINENCTEDTFENKDKSLLLWKIDDLDSDFLLA